MDNNAINNLLNKISLPSKNTINDKVIKSANEFLDGYIQSKQLESSSIFKKPNFKTSIQEDQAIDSIYHELSLRLPSEGNSSITNAIDYIDVNEGGTVDSYNKWDLRITTHLSIKDVFESSTNHKIRIIKEKFKDIYPLLLINSYKYEFTRELITLFNPDCDDDEIVYRIIILTVSSLSDKSISSQSDHYEFQENMRMPPNWGFCKDLCNSLKIHFILQNKNYEEITLYNKHFLNPRVKIIFDFYSSDLIILRHASFDN